MPHLTLNARRQHGVVLITSLLILLVMTLIGVTAMQTNIQQEQMAGNMNDRNMAFQAAETALRFAEEYLEIEKENGQEYVDSLFNGAKAGLLSQAGDEPKPFEASWDDTDSVDIKHVLSDDIILNDVYENPRYMITLLASRWPTGSEENFSSRYSYSGNRVPKLYIFRITARGRGGSDSGQVVLRSTYAMLVN